MSSALKPPKNVARPAMDLALSTSFDDSFQEMDMGRQTDCPRHHNLLHSIVLQLPDELISDIFLHHIDSIAGPLKYGSLLNLQLVCWRFYHVSDTSPRLWTYINNVITPAVNRSLPLLDTLLEKSRNAPLDITLKLSARDDHLDLLEKASLHCHRWQTFRCEYAKHSTFGIASSCRLQRDMKLLASLQAPQLREFAVNESKKLIYSAQTDLLGGYAPYLQRLDIKPIAMSWDSRLLSGLTFLRITAWDGVRPPTEEQYLRVLTSCPNLEELYISGRDDDCREEGLPAVFHTPIPLPRLKTLSLDSLHPTAVRSLLSSIQANPQNLVVLFSYTLTIRWNEVLDMTILFPACRHLLSRFLSSPDTIQFTDDNHGVDVDDEDDTLARFFRATSTSAEGQSSCHLTCGFHNFPFPSVLYPALLPISTYKDIHTLVIGIDTRDLLIRKMLEESVDLKEIRLVSGIKNIWIALQPLAKPLPSSPESPSAAKWLCPRLHKLVIEGTDFDIRGLWKFLELRYGNTGSAGTPTPLSHLHVSRNGAYSGLDKVPLEVASDIAGVVEKGGFVWDSHVFDRDDGKWVAL